MNRFARFARPLYVLALVVISPLAACYLLYRARRQAAYLRGWSERFGWRMPPQMTGRVIWIHAVSVGETRAAAPMIERMKEAWPDVTVFMTHMTPTGRQTSEELFGNRITRAYLPYDYPWAMRRLIERLRPALIVLMETEVWPNLVHAATRAPVPIVLANARLSSRSLQAVMRWRALMRPAMEGLSMALAQTEADATRLLAAGVQFAVVTGNMKFDIVAPEEQIALGRVFSARLGHRKLIMAASTREGEEALILDAFVAAGFDAEALLVLIPRHPQRFNAVAELISARQLNFQRRSDDVAVASSTRVWLGDSMGEMFAYYSTAKVAYVGGGLLPYGTHNLIEPCSVGCGAIVGPHTFNFAQAVEDAIDAGAAVRVSNAHALMEEMRALYAEPSRLADMAERAEGFSRAHRGATGRTLDALGPLLRR